MLLACVANALISSDRVWMQNKKRVVLVPHWKPLYFQFFFFSKKWMLSLKTARIEKLKN